MLRQRAASSLFIVGFTLAAAILGRLIFALFVAVMLGLALREIVVMFRHAGYRPSLPVGLAAVVVASAAALRGAWSQWTLALVTATLFGALFALLPRRDYQGALLDWALTVAGALYLALPAAHLILLRELPGAVDGVVGTLDRAGWWQPGAVATSRGLGWFLLAQVVTWLTDVGAYAVGRVWGRRKLAPAISPGKSVEGAVGGLAGGALAAWGCAALFGLPLAPLAALGAGALLSLVGQLGDLAESLLKRQTGVKDSGTLIPGHGGVLDRVDSLLVVAILTYYLALFAG